jgi:putative ABC transport system ATP-binding protein
MGEALGMESLIVLDDVWKTYTMGEETVYALKKVNLTIAKNDFVALLGPSGSGKSTLMNMVGCLDVPSRGKLYLFDTLASSLSENALATLRGKHIGFVFQKFNLVPTLTALENVALPALFQGTSRKERYSRAEKLLSFVGLSERLHHKPSELSGGEQQRVAIARSMINDPDIILADEPTGNLDSKNGAKILSLFKKLHNQGKTIVFVTHDAELARSAQRIVRLKDGEIRRAA